MQALPLFTYAFRPPLLHHTSCFVVETRGSCPSHTTCHGRVEAGTHI